MKIQKFNIKQSFIAFLIAHLTIWALIPFLFRGNAPLDSIEAVLWGQNWTFGYDKHPPLSGWVAELSYLIFNPDLSVYILSQISIVLGFVYIFRLAKEFLTDKQSLLSVFLLEGILYYNFISPEFNVNVLGLFLVPACIFYFYKTLFETGKKSNISAILFGLFCSLLMITKYINGIFLLAFLITALLTKKGKSFLFSKKVLLSAVGFLPLIIIHFLWMIESEFITITYAFARGRNKGYSVLNHLVNPIKFIGEQLPVLLGFLIAFVLLKPKLKKKEKLTDKERFLLFCGLIPLLIIISVSLITGLNLKGLWGFQTYALFGVLSLYFFKIDSKKYKRAYNFLLGFILFTIIAYICQCTLHLSKRTNLKGKFLSMGMQNIWSTYTDKPLYYVGGDMWLAGNVSFYHKSFEKSQIRPRVIIDMNKRKNLWLDEQDLLNKGVLIFAKDQEEAELFQSTYPRIQNIMQQTIKINNIKGKEKEIKFYFMVMPPLKGKNYDN